MTTEVAAKDTHAQLAQRVTELIATAPRDTDDAGSARIALAIAESDSLAQIAGIFGGMDDAKKYENTPLIVTGFMVRESDYDDGMGVYATIFATIDTVNGGVISFNCGSQAVLMVLLRANEGDWFPFPAHITTKQTRNGFTVYNLVPDLG